MATTTFYLRPSTKDKGASIHLTFHYGKKKRFRYSTGLKIQNVKNWDVKKMRIKNVIEERFKAEVNNQLNNFQAYLEEQFVDLAVNQKVNVDNEVLKEISNKFFNKASGNQEENNALELMDFYSWYIINYTTKPLPTTGGPLSPGTAKTYLNSYKILKRFNDSVYKLTYKKITLSFYDDFIQWLHDQDYSSNYIGTQIKVLKTVLTSSTEKGLNTNLDYTKKYFRKPTEDIDNIFLTEAEIQLIIELDVAHFKTIKTNKTLSITPEKLSKARDLFIIGCSTGLRVSDFNRLTRNNIYFDEQGKSYFRLIVRKGLKPITIPINSTAQSILNANNGHPPERMPEQHINYCIKILGRLAGIDEMTNKTITKGGKSRTMTVPKHDLISNHTARRSFCTNAYLSGMPTADIMAISGHATEKVFYNYIKVNDLQRAVKIAEHNFFQ